MSSPSPIAAPLIATTDVEAAKKKDDVGDDETAANKMPATYQDIFKAFVLMGWTAFGGPAAHLGATTTRHAMRDARARIFFNVFIAANLDSSRADLTSPLSSKTRNIPFLS